MSAVHLLKPLVQKERIDRAHYDSLPTGIQPFAQAYDHIHRVTITPQKAANSRPARVTTLAAANWRQGKLMLINHGRVPADKSPTDPDDMRPTVFFTFGAGTQKFRTTLQEGNRQNYVEVEVKFE